MTAHVCQDCGLMHDAVVAASEPVEVTLARIAKEQAVEVAKIQARQERDWNETRVEVAAIETEATVAAAGVEGELIAAAVAGDPEPEADPAPIVIDAPTAEVDEEMDDAPPVADDAHAPHERAKPRGLGMW